MGKGRDTHLDGFVLFEVNLTLGMMMTNKSIIACSCQSSLASLKQALEDIEGVILEISRLSELEDEVLRIKPKIALLDYELLGTNNIGILRSICAETKIIVIGNAISEETEWELLKAGVKGCCRKDVEPAFLKQVVVAVQNGELWIRRTVTCRLINELGKSTAKNKAYQASLCLLNTLTQREYDIALRVGNGDNNKQIAKACGITERTVKAHLTEVFLKLGVTDRLNLALVLSVADRSGDIENSGTYPNFVKQDLKIQKIATNHPIP